MRAHRSTARRNVHGYRPPSTMRHRTSLCEALNRTLDTGVVVMGELVISVAGVDLLYLNLNVLLSSVETLLEAMDAPALTVAPASAVPALGSEESEVLCETTK